MLRVDLQAAGIAYGTASGALRELIANWHWHTAYSNGSDQTASPNELPCRTSMTIPRESIAGRVLESLGRWAHRSIIPAVVVEEYLALRRASVNTEHRTSARG